MLQKRQNEKGTHTNTISENQQYKITQNDSLQYKSSDCISETVKEMKLILIIKQGIEYNLQKLLPYPSIYKLLLSIPPTDF